MLLRKVLLYGIFCNHDVQAVKTTACFIYKGVVYVTKLVTKAVRQIIDNYSTPATATATTPATTGTGTATTTTATPATATPATATPANSQQYRYFILLHSMQCFLLLFVV